MSKKAIEQYRATGRRKAAVARVIIRRGDGKRVINGQHFEEYFNNPTTLMVIDQPMSVLECGKEWNVVANVCGGGKSGQAGAVRLGIARALLNFNEDNRSSLRAHGLLTRDPRVVERKKYGKAKARKRFQFSKR